MIVTPVYIILKNGKWIEGPTEWLTIIKQDIR